MIIELSKIDEILRNEYADYYSNQRFYDILNKTANPLKQQYNEYSAELGATGAVSANQLAKQYKDQSAEAYVSYLQNKNALETSGIVGTGLAQGKQSLDKSLVSAYDSFKQNYTDSLSKLYENINTQLNSAYSTYSKNVESLQSSTEKAINKADEARQVYATNFQEMLNRIPEVLKYALSVQQGIPTGDNVELSSVQEKYKDFTSKHALYAMYFNDDGTIKSDAELSRMLASDEYAGKMLNDIFGVMWDDYLSDTEGLSDTEKKKRNELSDWLSQASDMDQTKANKKIFNQLYGISDRLSEKSDEIKEQNQYAIINANVTHTDFDTAIDTALSKIPNRGFTTDQANEVIKDIETAITNSKIDEKYLTNIRKEISELKTLAEKVTKGKLNTGKGHGVNTKQYKYNDKFKNKVKNLKDML